VCCTVTRERAKFRTILTKKRVRIDTKRGTGELKKSAGGMDVCVVNKDKKAKGTAIKAKKETSINNLHQPPPPPNNDVSRRAPKTKKKKEEEGRKYQWPHTPTL
jgi:hypothetical protein